MKINGIDQQNDTVTTHFTFDNGNTCEETRPMVHVCCPACHRWVFFRPHILKARQIDGGRIYCPVGHEFGYQAASEYVIRQLHESHYELAERYTRQSNEVLRLERTIAGLRGTITRLKRGVK
jgi:hypothetical protein